VLRKIFWIVLWKKPRNAEIKGQRKDGDAEADVFLENGKKVMAVEVKVKPDVNDINEHVRATLI
jgi:hypothetical protein